MKTADEQHEWRDETGKPRALRPSPRRRCLARERWLNIVRLAIGALALVSSARITVSAVGDIVITIDVDRGCVTGWWARTQHPNTLMVSYCGNVKDVGRTATTSESWADTPPRSAAAAPREPR
jgi:hypothetical protein